MLKEKNFPAPRLLFKDLNQTIRKLFLFIVLFGFGFTLFGQTPNYELEWATHVGGGGLDAGTAIDVDEAGNVYTVGSYYSAGNFSTSISNPIPLSFNGGSDIFVTKQDSQGNTLWAKGVGGSGSDFGPGIVVDAIGNSYITGYFMAPSAEFGPDNFNTYGGFNSGGASADRDVFVTKFNTNGDFEWTKRFGGTRQDRAHSITMDNSGDIIVAGHFSSATATFGTITLNKKTLNNNGTTYDSFITKLDASGTVLWAKNFGGDINNSSDMTSIATDNNDNIYITGSSRGSLFIGTHTITSSGYVSKLDGSGNVLWAEEIGGGGITVEVDNLGYVYTTGLFNNTQDFGPFSLTATPVAYPYYEIYLSKQDAATGKFIWAKKVAATSISEVVIDNHKVIAVDKKGNIYRTGKFKGTVDFDPGSGTYELTSTGTKHNFFINILDTDGEFLWARAFECNNESFGLGIHIDNKGAVYSTGHFTGTSEFDPGPTSSKITTYGGADAFVQKLIDCSMYEGDVTSEDVTLCEGDTLKVTASNGSEYEWTGPNGFTSNDADLIIENIEASAAGIYQVVTKRSVCTDTFLVNVTVNPKPTFTLSFTDPTTCNGTDGTITISGLTAGTTYNISYENDGNIVGPTSMTSNSSGEIVITGLSAGDYINFLIELDGCFDTDIKGVTLTDLIAGPSVDAGLDITICPGDSVTLSADNPDNATITWDNGVEDGVEFYPTVEGKVTYTVTAEKDGCTSTDEVQITVLPAPDVSFTADPIEGISPLPVIFENTSTGSNTYWWNFADGSEEQNNDVLVYHTFENAGVYNTSLIGITDDGCIDTATLIITVLPPKMIYEFPNVFTPNGDSQNDEFLLINPKYIKSVEIFIVNRWGTVVFESNEILFSWNGEHLNSGAECTDGTYFYVAKLTDLHGKTVEEHGHITLVRGE